MVIMSHVCILALFCVFSVVSGTLTITLHPDVTSCSAAEYFQISDLTLSYTPSVPHLALNFTAVVGRTLMYNPWFAIRMTRPPYYRDVCEDNGETCAYQMCGFTTPSTEKGQKMNNCPIEKGKYNISVTLPAPPLVHSEDEMANLYTYTLDFSERGSSIGCQAFVFDALALMPQDTTTQTVSAGCQINVKTGPESFADLAAALAWLEERRRKVDTAMAYVTTAARTTRSAESNAYVPGDRPQIVRLSGSAPVMPRWRVSATA
ncbi:hypothetical protein MTO96_051051 [Rhipicephalus appendiculatus]